MDIYYINLERRTDRRSSMEQRFAELGLTANRISAVEPKELTAEQRRSCQSSLASSDPIIEVELCCNLSHKQAIEKFIASGAEQAAFFEDDVAIADDLPELLSRIDSDGLPCGILRLETFLNRAHYGTRPAAMLGRYAAHSMHGHAWGSAGYVMNKRAAELYVRSPKMLGIVTDRALWRRLPNATGIAVLQLVPAPVVQLHRLENSAWVGSDIAPDRAEIYKTQQKKERLLSKLQRFYREECTIALPSLIHRWLGLSKRGLVPFSG